MRNAAHQHGATFAMFFIPDEYQVNSTLLGEIIDLAGAEADDIDVDLPQRRLNDFCLTERVACLDLLPAFAGKHEHGTCRRTRIGTKRAIVSRRNVSWRGSETPVRCLGKSDRR